MHVCRRIFLAAGGCLILTANLAAQAPARVTGRVTNEDGNPIPSAGILVQGLNINAVTKSDGRYALLIPLDRITGPVTITARAINYKPKSVQVTVAEGETTQDFTLAANPLQLGEIVVTGAGTVQEVEKIGNVRNSVDSSLIVRSNETNIVNALSAKAPNVDVVSTAGDPGASTSIRIRGVNTLSGPSDPLFIVDGTPIDNSTTTTDITFGNDGATAAPNRASDINPADIESVEILKGAAAGAIYGARAGQGVVIITTKRGRPGGGVSYSMRTSLSVNSVNRFPSLQTQYGQGNEDANGIPQQDDCAIGIAGNDCTATSRSYGPQIPAGTPVYDHAREAFKNGYTTDNDLTISGGNDRTTFFVSGALMNQTGTIVGPHNHYNRISFRLKGTQRVSDRLTVGGNVAYASTKGDFIQKGSNFSGIALSAYRTSPDFNNLPYLDPVAGQHRSYRFPFPTVVSARDARPYNNPFFTANELVSTAFADRVYGNVTAELAALSWLKFNYTLGVDHGNDDRLQGLPLTDANIGGVAEGQVTRLTLSNSQFDHNLTATGSFTVSPKIKGDLTVGQNLNTRSFREIGVVGNDLIAPTPFSLTNTKTLSPPTDFETKIKSEGYFGQGTLDLNEQLYLKASLRYDGVSTYGSNKQRHWFPGAQAAWQFTKTLGDLHGVLSYGKLRLAYGQTGKEPDPYLTSVNFVGAGSFTDYSVGIAASQKGLGGLFTGFTRPATGLKPERTREIEGGIDVAVFKEIADLSFTVYDKRTTDAIVSRPIPSSTGYGLEQSNGAEISNKGTEWVFNIRPITKANFSWDVGIQVGTNRNRVLSIVDATQINYGGNGGFGISVAEVGSPVGTFQDLDFVRCGRGIILDNGGNPFDVDANCSPAGRASHAMYIDDGTFSSNGAGYPIVDGTFRDMGSPDPKWTGSLRSAVRIGKFNISGLLDIKHGGLVYNGTRGALNTLGTSRESADLRYKQVTFGKDYLPGAVDGPGVNQAVTLGQSWFDGDGGAFAGAGSQFYEDGGYVKLREISLGYTLTSDFVTRTLGLSSIDLRIAGRNLVTWTKYRGADPETNLGGAETGARGVDWFNSPQTRSYVFSVSLNR